MSAALPPPGPAPPPLPWSTLLDDRGLDDDLLRYLVGTVYGARGSLYASIIMGALVTLAAWMMTGVTTFVTLAGAHVIIGALRLRLLPGFGVDCARGCSRATIQSYDRGFTVWSTAYAALLGATFYYLLAIADGRVAMPLAVGGAVGFSIAFVTRHAGRLRLLALQVGAVLAPTICGLLTLPVLNGAYFAILFVGVWITTMVMGRNLYGRLVEHYRTNETNRRMAQFDMLTGAHNRYSFGEALAEAVQRANRGPNARFALATVDLDRFRQLNDTLGHEAGDRYIVEAAPRRRAAARPGDLVARLGGDEFVVPAFGEATDLHKLRRLGSRLAESLSLPVEIDGAPVAMSASVGVALYPEHARSADELRRRSYIALYEAKRAGRGAAAVFDAAMQSRLDNSRRLEIDFESALREDQFEAWFQPIQNIDTGAVIGYEALARWRHPQRGLILPDMFIPVAEQCGAIVPIGEAILRKACEAAARWDQRVTVAVNFSPRQFRDPQRVVERIKTTLEETGLQPSRLFVEITESLMLEDTPMTRAAVRALSEHGV